MSGYSRYQNRYPNRRYNATTSRSTYRAPVRSYSSYKPPITRSYTRPYVRRAPVRSAQSYKRKYYNNGSTSRSVGKLGGAAIGGYIGGVPGAALGSAIGSRAGDLFSSITGMGDYKVSYNTVVNPHQTPQFKNKGRSVFISHREYLTDIITSPTPGAFDINSFDLNPALTTTFPWLATIAQNFEQYKIHGMVFHYKSNSADALNSVNTALGTVILATQYNILLDPFRNKQEMENYEFGCSTRPSTDVLHPVECDPKVTSFGPIFDVKLGGNDKGDDRLYCPGRFSIATVGQQGTSVNIGELWITYDIEFFKPRMGDTASQISQYRSSAPFGVNSPFGSADTQIISESSDFEAVSINQDRITFDSGFTGQVMVVIMWKAPNNTPLPGPLILPDIALFGGVSSFDLFGPYEENPTIAQTDTPLMKYIQTFSVVSGGSIQFSSGLYTDLTRCDVVVTTIPNTIDLYVPENDL